MVENKTACMLWGLDPKTRKRLILSHQEARLRKRWLQVEQELSQHAAATATSVNGTAPTSAQKRKRRSLFPDDPSPPPDENSEDHPSREYLGIDSGHLADLTYVYSTLGTGYKDSVPLPPKALLKTLYDLTTQAPFYDVDHLSCNQVCRLSDQAWRLDMPDVEGEHKKFARQKQIAIFEQEHELAFIEKLRMVRALDREKL